MIRFGRGLVRLGVWLAACCGVALGDFEQRMFEIGAYSNARTKDNRTVYEVSTYSETTPVMLEALGKMLFAGELGQESFRLTKAVIRRESGGDPNLYEQWLIWTGQLTSAATLALRDISAQRFLAYPGADTGADVSLKEVRRTYARYYQPSGVTLVLVGDFDIPQSRAWVDEAFGGYSDDGQRPSASLPAADGTLDDSYRGVAPAPRVGLVTRTGGYLDPDYYALVLMNDYLENRLYLTLRVETGLTYAPQIYQYNTPHLGLCWASMRSCLSHRPIGR